MARTATPINSVLLLNCINEIEANGPLENRGKLYLAVAELYNSKKAIEEREITHSIVMLRIIENNIEVKSPFGRRGRVANTNKGTNALNIDGTISLRVINPNEVKVRKVIEGDWTYLENSVPKRFHGLVSKVKSGSKTAAIKMNCLTCSGYSKDIISNCHVKQCSFWNIRPYQNKDFQEDDFKTVESSAPTEKELCLIQGIVYKE